MTLIYIARKLDPCRSPPPSVQNTELLPRRPVGVDAVRRDPALVPAGYVHQHLGREFKRIGLDPAGSKGEDEGSGMDDLLWMRAKLDIPSPPVVVLGYDVTPDPAPGAMPSLEALPVELI